MLITARKKGQVIGEGVIQWPLLQGAVWMLGAPLLSAELWILDERMRLPLAKLGEKGIQGSSPASQGSKTIPFGSA